MKGSIRVTVRDLKGYCNVGVLMIRIGLWQVVTGPFQSLPMLSISLLRFSSSEGAACQRNCNQRLQDCRSLVERFDSFEAGTSCSLFSRAVQTPFCLAKRICSFLSSMAVLAVRNSCDTLAVPMFPSQRVMPSNPAWTLKDLRGFIEGKEVT